MSADQHPSGRGFEGDPIPDQPADQDALAWLNDFMSTPGSESIPTPELDLDTNLVSMRAGMDQFKALGAEVAGIIGGFYTELLSNRVPESDAREYSKAWAYAYMNLLWAGIRTGNGAA